MVLTSAEKLVAAQHWVEAWNSHDIEAIMSHYAPDVEFQASTVVTRWSRADGRLHGSAELREQFMRGLALVPNLRFELEEILLSPDGYAVLYRRENGNRVIDSVELDAEGRAVRVTAYYAAAQV